MMEGIVFHHLDGRMCKLRNTMSRFKPGDQAVCIKRGLWLNSKTGAIGSKGPKFNELVTIDGYNGEGCLFLVGYYCYRDGVRVAYSPIRFEPIITDSQLQEELKSIEKSKTIELV